MTNQAYYELYRRSSVGLSLIDTLDEMVKEGRIEPHTARNVLSDFDKSATEVLGQGVKARLNFKGHLDTYRLCDEVWTFVIKNVDFYVDEESAFHAEKIKIVSCNAKRPGEH